MNFKDLTGKKFGKLTVIKRVKNSKNNHARWLCECECENKVAVLSASLRDGNTRSCGCLQREKAREAKTKHGLANSRLYIIWFNIKQRCNNSKNPNYKHYGGRGIKICKEWQENFMSFYNWAMDNGYKEDLTIDRIDVNGNYEPNNCRWATSDIQANNMRTNRILTYKEETHNMKQWAKILNINYTTLHSRFRKGWTIEKAFTYKTKKRGENYNAK